MRIALGWLLGLLVLTAAGASGAFEIGEPHVHVVGDGGLLRDSNISALAEDSQGFIWIGAPSGLFRFDGYRFRRFDAGTPGSFSGAFVNVLHLARDGRLWIGTVADGLWCFDPRSERFVNYRHDPAQPGSLPHDGVYALAEDSRGQLWVGTVVGLSRFDPATGHFQLVGFGDAENRRRERIWSLRFDRSGVLWAGTGQGLARFDASADTLLPVTAEPADDGTVLEGDTVLSVLDSADGRLWIGTLQSGLLRFDPRDGRLTRPAEADPRHSVPALLQPDAHSLWVARYGEAGGIDVRDIDSGRLRHRFRHDPARRNSLASEDVRALLRDRAGHIWVGGYGSGLQRIDPQLTGVRTIGHSPYRPDLLSHPNVSSVLERRNGEIWVGTRGRGIDVLDRSRGVVGGFRAAADRPDALGSGWIAALAEAADGAVWVGGYGLYRFDPSRRQFSQWFAEDSATQLTVRRLLVDRAGTLWIGGSNGGWRLRPGAPRAEPLRLEDGTPLPVDINALVEDPNGRIWIGADPGLYTVAPGSDRLQPLRIKPDQGSGLSAASIVGLLVDRRGVLWMDTADGLYRLRDVQGGEAEFEAISARLGIAGHAFGANLLEDHLGRIWTLRYMYDPAAGSLYPLTRGDGVDLGTVWFRAYHKTHDGLLLFGGSRGLAVIDPARFRPWSYEPPLVATELRINGQPQPTGPMAAGLRLTPDQRSFSIEVAALDFTAPERNRYAYRLNGFDRDWIEGDAGQRVASYSNLWPGEYRLEVRATNRNGTWSRHELSIPITVEPAYWQTGWFAAIVLLTLTGSGFAGHRLRVARLRRRATELETEVARRTRQLEGMHADLVSSHEQLSRAHARLLETQQQLVMQEKMASLGQLVAGVAHEINTPLGIAVTVASMLSDSSREAKRRLDAGELRRSDLVTYFERAVEGTRMVDESLARAAQLVRSFKQVSIDRDSDQRRKFNLEDYLQTLLQSLEPGCRRRSVRFALDCQHGLELNSYPGAIAQVITQFTQNALLHAFVDRGGELRISAQAVEQGVELRFADDGAGIAAEDLPHIFEPFFTRRRFNGNPGLGLHIVYNLVTARLGGSIQVISELGAGTCFVLRLPRVAPE